MEHTGEEAWSILTCRHHEELALQKCGHGDLVETQGGEWYMVHLCGRPLTARNSADAPRFPGSRRYTLGRETAIQKVRWTEDDWLVLDKETLDSLPETEADAPKLPLCPFPGKAARDDFNEEELDREYQSLRVAMDAHYISLTERPGFLRMYGRSGLASRFFPEPDSQEVD